jgi:hypothetical protein
MVTELETAVQVPLHAGVPMVTPVKLDVVVGVGLHPLELDES